MTNSEKFEKVFGFYPDISVNIYDCPEFGKSCKYRDSKGCHCEDWWLEEYKGEQE